MKLASGIARIEDMLDKGVKIAIGTPAEEVYKKANEIIDRMR